MHTFAHTKLVKVLIYISSILLSLTLLFLNERHSKAKIQVKFHKLQKTIYKALIKKR